VTLLGAVLATGSMPTTEPASVSIIMSRFDTYSTLSVVIKVRGPDIYIPPHTEKPEQQRFTMRSGVLTIISGIGSAPAQCN